MEDGGLSWATQTLLVLLAILGLIWFVAELRPSAPRRVRMGSGTYVSRSVIQDEVSTIAEEVPDVLGSSVDVKARRSPGAQVGLEARVRRGEDLGTIKSGLQSTVRERLSEKGLPVSKLNVKLVEADPQADEDEGTVNAFNRLILLILSLLLLAVPVLLLLITWGFVPADVIDQYTGYRAAMQALGTVSDPTLTTGGRTVVAIVGALVALIALVLLLQGAWHPRAQGLQEHRDGRHPGQGDRDNGQRREDPRRERGEGGGRGVAIRLADLRKRVLRRVHGNTGPPRRQLHRDGGARQGEHQEGAQRPGRARKGRRSHGKRNRYLAKGR